MKTAPIRKRLNGGFVSYVLVLSTGLTLTIMMVAAYKRAASAQRVQSETQLRVDYADKEEAVLRALVNITPNRAIRAMQSGSSNSGAAKDALRWQNIFSEALDQANARTSISAAMKTKMGSAQGITANVGDSNLADIGAMFDAIEPEAGFMSPGVNRSLGAGFPVPLQVASGVAGNDKDYPIISNDKIYGNLASGGVDLSVTDYPLWNKIPYPQIRFGYCEPGELFVAKRNWWAFSMQLAENDLVLNSFGRNGGSEGERDFILSIYEIPSQLAISAEAFTSLGTHADGTAWQRTNIEGGIYSTRAEVTAGMHLDRLSGRRGLTLDSDVTVGDVPWDGDAFAPGTREKFEGKNNAFLPVSLGSESGRAAFVPINRGKDFFDRFAHSAESNVLSTTSWNNYSVGALQCAMRADITAMRSSSSTEPTMIRFSYMKGGSRTSSPLLIPFGLSTATPLQDGYKHLVVDGNAVVEDNGPNPKEYTITTPTDLAYGAGNKWYYKLGFTGKITFNNKDWGDPNVGVGKFGYFRPQCPFEIKILLGDYAVAVYPERIPAFLGALAADGPDKNHSLVVNVDYSTTGMNNPVYKPSIPCGENDCRVLLYECDNLTPFTKGFSLVTNLRLYIGDDFNVVSTTPPAGSNLPTPFYPPASLFAPEKRYGTDLDPFEVKIAGQLGHLGGDDESGDQVHLLDLKMGSGSDAAADKIDVNLKAITHPAELPPITMMNWLIVVEERHKAFYTGIGAN